MSNNNNNSVSNQTAPGKLFSGRTMIFVGFVMIAIWVMIAFIMTTGAKAASGPGSMQKSLASHGVTVDAVTAERVRRACVQSGVVTADVIAEFQGSKQVVTVQCASNDDISDAVVRTFAPPVTK